MFVSRELPITYVRKQAEILSISARKNVQQFITPEGQRTCDDSKGSKRPPRECSSAARGSAELVAAEGVAPQDPAAGNCWGAEGGVQKRKNSARRGAKPRDHATMTLAGGPPGKRGIGPIFGITADHRHAVFRFPTDRSSPQLGKLQTMLLTETRFDVYRYAR